MKLKTKIGMSLLAVGAAGLFAGCSTCPVGEGEVSDTFYHSAPTVNGGTYLNRYSIRAEPAMVQNVYRPFGIEPVGERILPGGNPLNSTLDSQVQESLSPYGPNSPCVRSLWW